jgi:hypothetical protein
VACIGSYHASTQRKARRSGHTQHPLAAACRPCLSKLLPQKRGLRSRNGRGRLSGSPSPRFSVASEDRAGRCATGDFQPSSGLGNTLRQDGGAGGDEFLARDPRGQVRCPMRPCGNRPRSFHRAAPIAGKACFCFISPCDEEPRPCLAGVGNLPKASTWLPGSSPSRNPPDQ